MSNVPTSSPDIGLVLNDRYRVEELIARGGMATVYRGFDERLHRPVALKIMHPHLADNPEFLSRFSREARSAARLAHPHVVSVYDQADDQGRVYLALQLVEGETLRDELRREKALSLKRSLQVGRDVLAALDAAHRSGIIHRDVKPENVLVNKEKDIFVADFGLARAVDSATSSATGTLMGTVAYVSPEVVTRGVSDARSDLYSWGVMLYEMLTGRTPFTGESAVHIAYQHVHEDIPAPSRLNPGLPPSVDALVTWATARLPSSRPARAHEILLALDEALDELSPEQLALRAPRAAGREAASTGEIERPTVGLAHPPAARGDSEVPGNRALSAFVNTTALASLAENGTDSSSKPPRRRFLPEPDDPSDDSDQDQSIREVQLPARERAIGWHGDLPRRSPVFGIISVVALVVGLGALAGAGQQWYVTEGPGAARTVPILAGASLADAESALEADQLTLTTHEAHSDTVPEGHVIDASPAPGTSVKRGDAIDVTVSLGEELFAVPELEGQRLDAATTALEDIGFSVTTQKEYSETVPADQVIRIEPAGKSLPRGSEVTAVMSQGPEPIAIPQVIGQPRASAIKALEDAGFSVKTSEAHSASVPAGNVSSQNPASGNGRRGQEVSIVVSTGPDMVKVPNVFEKPEAEAKAALESAGFKVAVQYDRGTPVLGLVYQQSVNGGEEAARGSTITINVF